MKFRDYDNYEIYEDGRIFSYWTNKFLKPQTTKNGYKQVWLYDNEGKRKLYLVHRVIWEAVTGNPIPSEMQINHISEDKTENFFENLELVSPKQNINFGSGNYRRSKSQGKQVGAFKNNELVMTFHSTNEAQRQGFNHGNVAACCRNCYLREGNNVYKGYEWKYI